MPHPVHLRFERDGDLLFHFFGGAPRPLRDHLDPVVRYVGIGFHRQIVERDRTPDQKQKANPGDDQFVVQCEVDYVIDHRLSTRALFRVDRGREL